MSNVVKKVGGAIGIGPKKKADTVAMAELATGTTVKQLADQIAAPATPVQTEEQARAAAARKKRGGRTGQRGLLYASRLGGRGGGRGDIQDTLGPA